jgi:hypothetical protein
MNRIEIHSAGRQHYIINHEILHFRIADKQMHSSTCRPIVTYPHRGRRHPFEKCIIINFDPYYINTINIVRYNNRIKTEEVDGEDQFQWFHIISQVTEFTSDKKVS